MTPRGRLVVRARALRKTLTPQEVKVWLRLRELKSQGFRFRRQVPFKDHILDFACFQSRLIVEIDGIQHGFEDHAARDARRDAVLAGEGFRILRFANPEIAENIDGIVETIYLAGLVRLPPSRFSALLEPPSPRGGGSPQSAAEGALLPLDGERRGSDRMKEILS